MRKTGRRWLPVVAACLLVVTGCGGYYGEDIDMEGESPTMESLREAFQAEKYLETINLAQRFVRLSPGSRYLDEAQFLLARSEYEEENYIEAEDRFRRMMRDFPNSDFAEDAAYYLPLSILSQSHKAELDQRETLAAKSQFQSFLIRYPDSKYVPRVEGHLQRINERLAKKDFLNGETYRKMGRYESAVFYYQKVTEKWEDTPYAERSLYRLADVAKSRGRWNDALAYTRQYQALYPEGGHVQEISDIRDEAQKEIEADSAAAPESGGS